MKNEVRNDVIDITSAQDFKNAYEKFYKYMRDYLWPYNVVERLAEVEVDIFTSFIDIDKLQFDLNKLQSSIKEAADDFDDTDLKDSFDELVELADTADPEKMFSTLYRVAEVNPNEDKQIKPDEEDESSDEEPDELEEPEERSTFEELRERIRSEGE